MKWWKKRLCARVRLKGLATGNSICEGDKVNRLMKWWPPILWPKPRTLCFQDLTWSKLKTGIHPTKSWRLLWNRAKAPIDALWQPSMYSENQLTLSSQATHYHLIKSPSLIIPTLWSHMQWLKSGCSMITPLSQQYRQTVKPLSHHDPSIIV